jgi:uncharacterized membrane protein
MSLLLRSFLEIVLFIRPPQDLPSDRRLLYVVVLSYFLMGLLLLFPKLGGPLTLMIVVSDIMVSVAFVQIVLLVKKQPQRLTQTLTAMFGAGTIISVMMLPLVYGIYTAEEGTEVPSLVAAGIYLLFAWSVAVNAHIFRYAFNLPNIFIGIFFALGLYLLTEMVMAMLFGAQLGAA